MHSPFSQVGHNAGVLSAMIDKELQKAREISRNQVDLLVLGDRDITGRWELLKRMQVRYGMCMGEDELRMYIVSIRSNIMETMRSLCLLVQQLGLEDQLLSESESEEHCQVNGRTPIECYRHILASLTGDQDCERGVEEMDTVDRAGKSLAAGPATLNHQARRFLSMRDHMHILWKVRSNFWWCRLLLAPHLLASVKRCTAHVWSTGVGKDSRQYPGTRHDGRYS